MEGSGDGEDWSVRWWVWGWLGTLDEHSGSGLVCVCVELERIIGIGLIELNG